MTRRSIRAIAVGAHDDDDVGGVGGGDEGWRRPSGRMLKRDERRRVFAARHRLPLSSHNRRLC